MLQIATGPQVLAWAAHQLNTPSFGPAEALGICRDGRLLAAIVYSDYNGANMEMAIASIDPRWCSKAALRIAFAIPFIQHNCLRVSTVVSVHNEKARDLAERLGFKIEGFHPKALRGGSDAFSLGLLRENCRWIGPLRARISNVGEQTADDTPDQKTERRQ